MEHRAWSERQKKGASFPRSAWQQAQGDLGHMPLASLGQDAALSFVVIGRGQEELGTKD